MFKLVSKSVKFLDGVIVTDMTTGIFPDMLLGVEVRGAWGKEEDFQGRMLGEKLTNGRTSMPGGAVPEQ